MVWGLGQVGGRGPWSLTCVAPQVVRRFRERVGLLSSSPTFICSCHALSKPGQVENNSDSLKLRSYSPHSCS